VPIEIRELHVRMNVTAGGGAKGGQAETGGGDGAGQGGPRAGDDDLVTRCVEEVMELLRNRTER
jgi:hypothetical protein